MVRASRLKAFASVLALLPALGLAVPASHAAISVKGAGDNASCLALKGRILSPGVEITSAEFDENGATVGKTHIDAPLCRVVGVA